MKCYQIKLPPLHHCPSCDRVAEQAGKGCGLKVGIFASGGQLYSRKRRGVGGVGGRWVLGLTCPAELQAVLLSLCTLTRNTVSLAAYSHDNRLSTRCVQRRGGGWLGGRGGGRGGKVYAYLKRRCLFSLTDFVLYVIT